MKRLSINQIFIKIKDQNQIIELKEVVNKLLSLSFVCENKNVIINNKNKKIVICIDTIHKKIFSVNTTCMACYVSSYGLDVMTCNDLLENFDKLVVEKDEEFYNNLIIKITNECKYNKK